MKKSILFDSSVWINSFRKNETKASILLNQLLREKESLVFLCPPVLQEILQGIKYKSQYDVVTDLLDSLQQLECQHYKAAAGASKIYFDLRKKGLTIRKPNDCLIAWYAIENNLTLAHDDVDFERIKDIYPLKTFH